jgi:hypothetical protein
MEYCSTALTVTNSVKVLKALIEYNGGISISEKYVQEAMKSTKMRGASAANYYIFKETMKTISEEQVA